MKQYKSLREAEAVFKALSAPMRLRIMELLYKEENKSLNDLAKELGITNSAVSLHVGQLEEAGLIQVQTVPGIRGNRKICKPKFSKMMIEMTESKIEGLYYEDNIKVGYYVSCEINPTCGLATKDSVVGEFDAPKYFHFPEHFDCEIFWFGDGYVEYSLPNRLSSGQNLKKLELSFEVSSECPGYNEDYPSDIHFSLNGIHLGYWISPGDFGSRRGRFTPDWWPEACNQYGLLKTLTIDEEGTFIDGGIKISDVTINQLNIDYSSPLMFRFAVPKETTNCRGFTIFGKGFGDYDQGIKLITYYN